MTQKLQCPLVPMQVERMGGFNYRITFHPPMDLPNSGDLKTDLTALMLDMNSHIEGWIHQ